MDMLINNRRSKIMANPTKDLIKRIQQSAASGTTEHLVNILKAGLATAPFCGGVASPLCQDRCRLN